MKKNIGCNKKIMLLQLLIWLIVLAGITVGIYFAIVNSKKGSQPSGEGNGEGNLDELALNYQNQFLSLAAECLIELGVSEEKIPEALENFEGMGNKMLEEARDQKKPSLFIQSNIDCLNKNDLCDALSGNENAMKKMESCAESKYQDGL